MKTVPVNLDMKCVLFLLLVTMFTVGAAQANTISTIIVSGDSNLGNGIDGSAGSPIANNGLFFKNLLGAGTTVALQTTTNSDSSETTSENAIENYYSSLPGVTVNTFAAVTPALLSGANLFIAFLPDVAFTPGEISAIGAFLNGGGTVLFTGEWATFDTGADNNINAVLAALGSTLQIDPANLDLGFHIASGTQIASDPLTAGIGEFTYAATSGVSGGTPLFYTTGGTPFVEYTSSTSTVPEPSTILLVAAGGLLLLALSWRRT